MNDPILKKKLIFLNIRFLDPSKLITFLVYYLLKLYKFKN